MKCKICWFPAQKNITIRQKYYTGLQFALVSQKNEQCHPFVWCKDFLHDVIYSSINLTKINLYDFTFDPAINPIPDLSKTKLLLANSRDKNLQKKILNCLDFINQIEHELKIKKTIAKPCCDCPQGYTQVVMIEGSKRWIQSPPMLSLYTLLLRVGLSHNYGNNYKDTIREIKSGKIKPYQKQDRNYLKSCDVAIVKILKHGDRKIFSRKIKNNYPVMSVEDIHNKLGAIGFSVECIKNALGYPVLVPSWHKNKD